MTGQVAEVIGKGSQTGRGGTCAKVRHLHQNWIVVWPYRAGRKLWALKNPFG